MTLTEFLLARIAEDEALAVPEPYQHYTHLSDAIGTWNPRCPTCVQTALGASADRLLAECAAKRAIVNAYLEQITPDEDGFANHREDDTFGWFDADRTYHHGTIGMEFSDGAFVALRNACRALALPYADHPDFDPAWRDTPET